jgi:hypothetical protein
MKTLVFGATALVLLGLAWPARGDAIYRYQDTNTKRDVFVTGLEQVPVEYRDQAKLMVADGLLLDSTNQQDKNVPQGTVIYGGQKPGAVETIKQALRDASRSGVDAAGLYRTLTTAIDTALVQSGRRPLSPAQVAGGKRLLAEATVALTVASLLSLAALIVVMAHAFRAQHRFWMVFMFLFPALGIVYVLIHVEAKRRWFKFATLFAQAAPFAVAAATVWRFVALVSTISAGG